MAAAKLLTQDEVADYLNVEVGTVENWRYKREGPDFIKVGGAVRYRLSVVEKYLDAKTVKCAS